MTRTSARLGTVVRACWVVAPSRSKPWHTGKFAPLHLLLGLQRVLPPFMVPLGLRDLLSILLLSSWSMRMAGVSRSSNSPRRTAQMKAAPPAMASDSGNGEQDVDDAHGAAAKARALKARPRR